MLWAGCIFWKRPIFWNLPGPAYLSGPEHVIWSELQKIGTRDLSSVVGSYVTFTDQHMWGNQDNICTLSRQARMIKWQHSLFRQAGSFDDVRRCDLFKCTIPLKEAASLLPNFLPWSFAALTLLSLNVLSYLLIVRYLFLALKCL